MDRPPHAYDHLGRITATTLNYLDGTSSGFNADDDVRSTFGYNALGERVAFCPAEATAAACTTTAALWSSTAWHSDYDAAGHLVGEIAPVNTIAGGTLLASSFTVYGPTGLPTTTCNATGACASSPSRKSVIGYDAVGRPTSLKTYQGASTLRLEWTTAYLGDGAIAWVAFDGTASSPSQGTDTISFTYDALGRPDQTKRGSTVLTDNAWNPDDTLASRADGSSGTSSFTYDWADRQASATSPIATGTVTTTYRLDGLVATRILGNGETATLAYDPAKRPTQVTLATGGTISQAYDRLGNVTSESRSLTGITGNAGVYTQTFSYDALRRVTKATIPGTNTVCGQSGVACYSYDRNGNRRTKRVGANTTAYVYDWTDELASQSINGGASTTFTFDAYGNQTGTRDSAGGLTSSAYDWADRLTSVTPPGGPTTTYSLDALGRPWTRSTGSSVDTYSYVGGSKTAWQVANTGGSGTTTSSALDATGARTAIAGASLTGYLAFDLHGNLVAAENGSKIITDALRYDAWGEVIASATSALPTPWRYQGRLDLSPDAANPLYDYGARAYRPVQGAFTSLDTYAGTVIDPLSMNRYLYAEANPATLIDPDGHIAAETTEGTGYTTYQRTVDALDCRGTRCYGYTDKEVSSSGDGWVPPEGFADAPFEAPEGYRWVPGPAWKPMLVDDACTVDDAGFLSEGCQIDDLGGALLFAAVPLGAFICVAVCVEAAAWAGATRIGSGIIGLVAAGRDKVETWLHGWGPAMPAVSDPKLQTLAQQLYREGATIGHGGTADAIRAGVGHIQKGGDYIGALMKWIIRNPNADPADLHAAQVMLTDLIAAMAGKKYPAP